MSLLAWYPLQADMKNQGIENFDLTIDHETFVTSSSKTPLMGKGKVIEQGYATWTAAQTAKILNNNELSICFWVYTDSEASSTYKRAMFFGNDGGTGLSARYFSIFQYPNCNCLHLSWWDGTQIVATVHNVLPSYEWTHVGICYKKGSVKIYINGALIHTEPVSVNINSYAVTTNVIYPCKYRSIADYRFYNNCLSAKEVKEISKGLFIHYPLNNQYEQSILNKYTGVYTEGYCVSGGFTVTKLANERGYNYKMTYTATASRTWRNIEFPEFSFTVGKKYYYSLKIRANKASNCGVALRAARISNDWVTNAIGIDFSSNSIGVWKEYYVYQTMPESFVRRDETITEMHPRVEFYTSDLVGEGVLMELDFDIKDVQVVESDVYVPYIENTYIGPVTNTSGLGVPWFASYNEQIVGTIEYNSNSPRYNGCMHFNNQGYFTAGFDPCFYKFTMNIWVKPKSNINNQHFLLGTFYSWPNSGVGIYRDKNNPSNYYAVVKSKAESSYGGPGEAIHVTLDEWNMITLVYTGTKVIAYVNGTKQSEKTYGLNGEILNDNITIGNSKYPNNNPFPSYENEEAYISDFRLYVTALSDEDIKELYENVASIANNGSLMCYEFIEE